MCLHGSATHNLSSKYPHQMFDVIADASTEENHFQLAELTGATLYTLARRALYPSVDFNTGSQPEGVSALAVPSLGSSGEGTISAFAAQIGNELRDSAQDVGHRGVGYETLCAAMAAESCVAAAVQALAAAAMRSTHRNPFHEILAGANEVFLKGNNLKSYLMSGVASMNLHSFVVLECVICVL